MDLETQLINTFLDNHPEEAAQALNSLRGPALAQLLEAVRPQAAARGLQHVLPKAAAEALACMDGGSAAEVLQELPVDAQIVFLHRMSAAGRETLLSELKPAHAAALRRFLDYPEGSAGNLMSTSPVTVRAAHSVREAMNHIRHEAQSVRYYIYVIDEDHRLVGVVTLRQLLQAKDRNSVASIMETNVVSLPATASERDIITHPRWKDFHGLPVVNRDGMLLGVIRYETLGRLKEIKSRDRHEQDVLGTLLALGELYWLGMTGSLDAMAVRRGRINTPTHNDGESDDH